MIAYGTEYGNKDLYKRREKSEKEVQKKTVSSIVRLSLVLCKRIKLYITFYYILFCNKRNVKYKSEVCVQYSPLCVLEITTTVDWYLPAFGILEDRADRSR